MTITTDRTIDPSPALAETQLVYDGRSGELFVLWLKVLLLGAVTLGIYSRFWGRTRIRRYFWSHVSLLGERFEYDGSGGELFRRFLLALFLFPLLYGIVFGVGVIMAKLHVPPMVLVAFNAVMIVLFVFFLVFVGFVAQYGSRRYQVSRTSWHGIRGGVEGSAAGYAFRAIGYTLLLPITLGLAMPWQYVGLWRYKTNNTGFGDVDFHFEGRGAKLMGPFLVAYACGILGFLLAAGVAFLVFYLSAGMPRGEAALKGATGAVAGAVIVFYVTYIGISLIGYLHFFVRAFAYTAGNTRFGRVSFAFPVRKRQLFWFQLGNILLLVVTLGLGMPFVAQRYVRFLCRHLRLYGASELTALTQAPGRRRPKGGEGLAQLFDTLDVGGFI
jgi:uncharacterized membrane protein YjgN (DUF898 family)